MRCLFIKPKMIGDTLLLTPTLQAAREKFPASTIDVLVRRGTETILAGCTAHNRVFLTAPPHAPGAARQTSDEWRTIRELRKSTYDWIFECSDSDRGRTLALLARGRRRVLNRLGRGLRTPSFGRWFWLRTFTDSVSVEYQDHHAAETDYLLARDFLGLPANVPALSYRPSRFYPDIAGMAGEPGLELSPNRLVLHPGTRLASKAWPEDCWLELVDALAASFDQIFISAGPDEAEQSLARRIASRAPGKIHLPSGPLPWGQLAALLQGARLFVGVDTAALHLASACQCPSLAIWGPTSAVIWGPRHIRSALVVDNRAAQPPYGPAEAHDESRLASRNSAEVVIRAARGMLQP